MSNWVVALILIAAGLGTILVKEHLPPDWEWANPFLAEVSSAILVGGVLGLLAKFLQDKESITNLRRMLRIHDSVDELGLVEIKPQSQAYDFTEVIASADKLSIVLNDGKRWVGNNTVNLRKRFGTKSETEFFITDPDSSFVPSLAAKTGETIEHIKEKIHATWGLLEQTYNESDKRGTLTIWKLKNYPTKAIFLTEDTLIETPYQTASGRINVPVMIYKKVHREDSPYTFVADDVEALRKECSPHRQFIP